MPPLLRRFLRQEPTEIVVAHDGATATVVIRRRATSRRLTLRVSGRSGKVALTAPEHVRFATIQAFADSQAAWVVERIARRPERFGFAPGGTVPVRGVPHRIVLIGRARASTRLGEGENGELAILIGGDATAAPGRVRRFLASEAARDLDAAVARYTEALGVEARKIAIRDTTSRWGSCSSTGTLSFSWRLVMAPAFVLDYLAAHEVAHLKEMNHSASYWTLLRGLCPDTDAAERWLKRNGPSLHRFG